jgi:hypothetical protein
MIIINQTNVPLDLDVSLNDLFSAIRQHQSYKRTQDITYSYRDVLTIREHIGIPLGLDKLIYYPNLCKALRTLKQLFYEVELSLRDIPTLNEKGLVAISKTISTIQEQLNDDRNKKSKLNAQFNNLIYLHGQNTTTPILRDFKPYYTMRRAAYNHRPPLSKKLNISGINYYLNYQGKRFGAMQSLYHLSEHHLLGAYYEATKKDETAIKRVLKTDCIGGFINTPVFAFRVKSNYKQAGKKYYVDLATNATYSRMSDAKSTASNYYINPQLTLLERIK